MFFFDKHLSLTEPFKGGMIFFKKYQKKKKKYIANLRLD